MRETPFLRSFIKWKAQAGSGKFLRRVNGRFVMPEIHRDWAAYQEGSRVCLPETPPDDWLEAMADKGVRREWCADVYKALREKVLQDLEMMKK